MTEHTDLDKLEAKLAGTASQTNLTQVARELDAIKAGTLLSIARSLEANKVPDHWESLEGPSGAILGWFDPQVARAIAQALGASQAAQEDEPDEPLPIEVGSTVVLADALALAGDDLELVGALTMGEVVGLGVDQDEPYAVVSWDDESDEMVHKVWVSHLTALEQRVGEAVDTDEPEVDEREADIVNGVDTNPPAEVHEPDDIDDDFDTVVEPEPAAPVDGLSALKGKSKGKRR